MKGRRPRPRRSSRLLRPQLYRHCPQARTTRSSVSWRQSMPSPRSASITSARRCSSRCQERLTECAGLDHAELGHLLRKPIKHRLLRPGRPVAISESGQLVRIKRFFSKRCLVVVAPVEIRPGLDITGDAGEELAPGSRGLKCIVQGRQSPSLVERYRDNSVIE
jgi:hypothetical protein